MPAILQETKNTRAREPLPQNKLEQFQRFRTGYLDTLRRQILFKNPFADVQWIEIRKKRTHLVLPFIPEGDYDFVAINTPSTYEQGAIPTGEEPPIGMLRVVASAVQAGYKAGSLEAHGLNLNISQIVEQLILTRPKLVGLNPTSVNVPEAKAIALACDELGIPYILGGIHATLGPDIARLDFPRAYAIVRGDGERAISDLLAQLLEKKEGSIQGVYGLLDVPLLGAPYAAKMPIESVPSIKQRDYVEFPLIKQEIPIHGTKFNLLEASLYTTRGCPFECGFCASPVMVNRGHKGTRPYDHPGMEKVVDEVQDALLMGAEAIHFLDDMVVVQPNDITEFYNELKDRGLLGQFVWRGMTRAPVVARDSFTPEVMNQLVTSGCWRVTLGVESGDDEILKKIKKQITVEQVEIALKKLSEAGIQTKAFFIMGFPGETYDQMIKTYNYIMRLKKLGYLHEISIFQFKPYPGTALWNEVEQTAPEALKRLDYIGGDARRIEGGKRSYQGVWLPDDLQIAAVPSKVVRELVIKTLADFYGTGIENQMVDNDSCA